MQVINFTAAHWAFLLSVVAILGCVALRKGVIIPSIVGIFLVALLSHRGDGALNSLIYAVQVIFKALLNAGTKLFDVILIIALMVAMLRSLQAQGADQIMIAPLKKLMVGPWSAFFVLAVTMYTASAFFWPTPAVALVGTVLIPVAMRVGLPAVAAAVAVNLAGHGMSLSADPVIQGATRLSAGAAGIAPSELYPYTLVLSLIYGAVAISLSCLSIRRDMRLGVLSPPTAEEMRMLAGAANGESPGKTSARGHARICAIVVPIVLLSVMVLLVTRAVFTPKHAIVGGAATALLGGTAVILLVFTSVASHGIHALDSVSAHTRDGFLFAIKIFGPIIPIAGFFFLGNPEHAVAVMGQGTPGFLFDFGNYIGNHLGSSTVLLSAGITFVSALISLNGSGFAGLPLTGSLAGALGGAAGMNVAALAALGQVVTIASAMTLVEWGFGACADAGVAGIAPSQLVRRNYVPSGAGILVITIFTAIIAR